MSALQTAFTQAAGITPNALALPIKTLLSAALIAGLLVVVITGYQTLMSSPDYPVSTFFFVIMRTGILLTLWLALIW